MRDMTTIEACGLSNADFNQITYSHYYNQNYFKSVVQAFSSVAGAVSDTYYNKRARNLQDQNEFAHSDLVDIDGTMVFIPFVNTYNK